MDGFQRFFLLVILGLFTLVGGLAYLEETRPQRMDKAGLLPVILPGMREPIYVPKQKCKDDPFKLSSQSKETKDA